jgi:hypothetical protein
MGGERILSESLWLMAAKIAAGTFLRPTSTRTAWRSRPTPTERPRAFDVGRKIKVAKDHNEELKKIFQERMRTSKCFPTDGSQMEDKPYSLTFTAEALEIGETLEIIEKIHSEQNFMIFSDSASVLKGISNSSTMKNTSQITQMLKDKIERWQLRGKIIQFYWIPAHWGIERADSEAKQASKEGKVKVKFSPLQALEALRVVRG